jgi:hypothetical protein
MFMKQTRESANVTYGGTGCPIGSLFVWLVAGAGCSERKVLLAGCWWLICCEIKVMLAGG